MIDRIKSFFETLQDRHYLAQGLALQEKREKVKRLEKELAEAKEQITAMKAANQKTFLPLRLSYTLLVSEECSISKCLLTI